MFVCKGASAWAVSQPYSGPFNVLPQRDKFFTLQMGSRSDKVAIDCLKPIHGSDPVPQQPSGACGSGFSGSCCAYLPESSTTSLVFHHLLLDLGDDAGGAPAAVEFRPSPGPSANSTDQLSSN